jgi:hypothetical protein
MTTKTRKAPQLPQNVASSSFTNPQCWHGVAINIDDLARPRRPQRVSASQLPQPAERFGVERKFIKAYNSADEAALAISLAGDARDDDRPSFLDTTKDHLYRTAEYLVMW